MNATKDDLFKFLLFPTRYGRFRIYWVGDSDPRVIRILLTDITVPGELTGAAASANPVILEICEQIHQICEGEEVSVSLNHVALDSCSPFQQHVLRAEYSIPRGRVSTYGLIAARLGKPGGARAVGRALANNPFPLIIPCHRAVQADGSIGGYQGGWEMKFKLLSDEGVKFKENGRVEGPFHNW